MIIIIPQQYFKNKVSNAIAKLVNFVNNNALMFVVISLRICLAYLRKNSLFALLNEILDLYLKKKKV